MQTNVGRMIDIFAVVIHKVAKHKQSTADSCLSLRSPHPHQDVVWKTARTRQEWYANDCC